MKGPFLGLFLLVSLASSGKICTWNTQTTDCVGDVYSGTCVDGRCECSAGYILQGEMCIGLGTYCVLDNSSMYFDDVLNYYYYYGIECDGVGHTTRCVDNQCQCAGGLVQQVESCGDPYPPTININGTTMANNSQYNIVLGDKVMIRCRYDNGLPVTLHVGQSSYTEDEGTIVSAVHVGDQLQQNTTMTCAGLTVSLITSADNTTQEVDTTSKKLQTILIVSILGSVTLVGFLSVGILYLVKWKKAMNAKTSPADIGKEGIVSP